MNRHQRQAAQRAFARFAERAGELAGSPVAFAVAVGILLVWALTGPLFHFSDTWQLVINTGTTIVTFLLGFLISNMQNRGAKRDHAVLGGLARMEKQHGGQLDALHAVNAEQLEILRELRALRQDEEMQPAKPKARKVSVTP